MARPLRRPREITYPENPWKGIARVTVRRKDYRFDGKYGSPESVEQHAEWVRIYDETGRPPEIETVRASLHIQRERIPLPRDYESPQAKMPRDRFALSIGTAIGCTMTISISLVASSLIRQNAGDQELPSYRPSPLFVGGSQPPNDPRLKTIDSMTPKDTDKLNEIIESQGHKAAVDAMDDIEKRRLPNP